MRVNKEIVKLELAKQKLTITELSKRSGINIYGISRMLNSDRNVRPLTIGKLATGLGLSVEKILLEEED